MFWSHTPRQPWQTPKYYAEQRRSLRPTTYLRLHENRWVTAESVLITREMWDGCVDASHAPLPATPGLALAAGIDAAYQRDCTAVVAVTQGPDGRLLLARHRIWTPRPDVPLNLEQTVEAYVLALTGQFTLVKVLADPFQLISSIARLTAAGVPIEAYPQSVPNTTKMATTVLDLLRDRQLVLYPDPEMRAHALATVGVETSRGFRVAKEKASQKIDAIVALAMACVAATDVFTAEAARAAQVAAAMDPRQIAREERAIHEAMPVMKDLHQRHGEPYGGWGNVVGDGLDDDDRDYQVFQ
jgi:hypothetical protein